MSEVEIPFRLEVEGTGISDRALRIQSDAPVSIQVLTTDSESNCGAFTVLPVPALSSNYIALQYWPSLVGNSRFSQIAVVAVESAILITFRFPIGTGIAVLYNGQIYPRDGDLIVSLDAFQAIQLQDTVYSDLSGTTIDATGKIAVFAGNIHTAIGDNGAFPYSDHVIEQMPPIETWGTTFGIISAPNGLYGDRIKVVAKEDQTVFKVNDREYTLQQATNSREIELNPGEIASVISDKPVLVAQFTSSRRGTNEEGMPSMLIVPPVQQYRSEYYFAVPDGDYDTELMIVIDSRLDPRGLLLDGAPLTVRLPQWNRVPGTYYDGTVLSLSAGSHSIRHSNSDVRFGAYVLGTETSNECGFAYTAGVCLDDLNVVSLITTQKFCSLIETTVVTR